MKQETFTDIEYSFRKKKTKREEFLEIMDEIIVTAEKYARSVEIQCGADVLLEDNFFDMTAGTKVVKILRGKPDSVSVRSVYDIR